MRKYFFFQIHERLCSLVSKIIKRFSFLITLLSLERKFCSLGYNFISLIFFWKPFFPFSNKRVPTPVYVHKTIHAAQFQLSKYFLSDLNLYLDLSISARKLNFIIHRIKFFACAVVTEPAIFIPDSTSF